MFNKFVKSKVISNKKLNDKFHLLEFKVVEGKFDFQCGQYVDVKIENLVFRSYSIASLSRQLPLWNILVDITPGGLGSSKLRDLKVGEIIETTEPTGFFTVKNDGSDYAVFGATGCGIASIKPMIEEMLKKENLQIKLFWGLRYEKDIIFFQELKKLEEKYSNFNFEIFLSQPPNNWKGKYGHITDPLYRFVKSLSSDKTSVYLCGNNNMITDISKELYSEKFPFEKIYFESYYQ